MCLVVSCLHGSCVQYDVDIVHGIEAEVGHQLAESTALEEAAVLKGITRVFAAKRAAALRDAEVAHPKLTYYKGTHLSLNFLAVKIFPEGKIAATHEYPHDSLDCSNP